MKKISLICILVILILYLLAKILSPGSYLDTEEFKIYTNESSLIKSINEFKDKNPKFVVPQQYNVKEGRMDSNDYWYHVGFFFSEDSSIAHAWVRQTDFKFTKIGLVSIKLNDGDIRSKIINKDFSSKENKRQIERFEKEIIDPLRRMAEK